MKKSGAIIALVVLIAVGAGAFALTRNKKDTPVTPTTPPAASTTNTTEPPAPSPATTPTTPDTTATTVITYSDSGFSPGSSTVKSGGSVTVKNTSSRTLDFASNPHPVHTDNRELSIGTIPAGGSKTFTVTKTGAWGFHNHLRSGDTGKLVVE